jgi:DDB1- and CUL4-associated factor 7
MILSTRTTRCAFSHQTVWDISTQQVKTQLIAHDKEVFDVAFARGVHVFASVGADGSVRMFDLRSLEHSTILFESPPIAASKASSKGLVASSENAPLLRLAWNKQDPNYLATFCAQSNALLILDIRIPTVPVTELHSHTAPITAFAWAPHSSGHICTTGMDGQALVWDISQVGGGGTKRSSKYVTEPILAYSAPAEIGSLAWDAVSPEWVGITYGDCIQALRV